MSNATIACSICLKGIKEETPFDNSMLDLKLSTFPSKAELGIDENLVACSKCVLEIDEANQIFIENKNILKTECIPESLPINTSLLSNKERYSEKKFKEEFVEVVVKSELVVKDENADLHQESVSLNYHYNYATNNSFDNSSLSDENFTCDRCDYKCCDKTILNHHIRHVHVHEKYYNEFSCDTCDYKCCNKTEMTRHRRGHIPNKYLKCKFCDYCSNRSGNLKRHSKKHEEFSCNKCDYKCYNKTAMTHHIRRHIREKLMKCTFCDYCTNKMGNLKRHLYQHSDERPFSCGKCDYKCRDKSALAHHIKKYNHK